MRYTGAPVICANVLQWAPSRVTRRGAPAATAAAAAAFPPLPRYLPPPSVSLHTHARPLLPLGGPRSSWSRGPLGTPTSPLWGPMVAWQAAFSYTKYTFAVPFTPEQRNGRFLLLPPPSFVRSPPFSLCYVPTLSRYHFLSAPSFACSPERSCGYQYSVSKLLECFISFHDFYIFILRLFIFSYKYKKI